MFKRSTILHQGGVGYPAHLDLFPLVLRTLTMASTFVDSEVSLVAFLNRLYALPIQPPSLYVDVEGVNLSRYGSVSILQTFVLPLDEVFLIDVFALGEKAFNTPNQAGRTLRTVLESASMPKVFFDVRNDADALFAHYKIQLQAVHDIQLMEFATRNWSKERVVGLAHCIQKDAHLSPEAKAVWKANKKRISALFASELGGSYEVFNVRPLPQDTFDYCTQDVRYLHDLWSVYNGRMSRGWRAKVREETEKRLFDSQSASYDPKGKFKIFSPWAKAATGIGKGFGDKNPSRNSTAAERVAMKAALTKDTKRSSAQAMLGGGILGAPKPLVDLGDLYTGFENLAFATQSSQTQYTLSGSGTPIFVGAPKQLQTPAPLGVAKPAWTCTVCAKAMQQGDRKFHLAGKPHNAKLQNASATGTHPTQGRHKAPGSRKTKAPQKSKTRRANARTCGPTPSTQPLGQAYQDYQFVGFQGTGVPQSYQYDSSQSYQYDSWHFQGCGDYGLCDKDCGWCGRCMDGVDV